MHMYRGMPCACACAHAHALHVMGHVAPLLVLVGQHGGMPGPYVCCHRLSRRARRSARRPRQPWAASCRPWAPLSRALRHTHSASLHTLGAVEWPCLHAAAAVDVAYGMPWHGMAAHSWVQAEPVCVRPERGCTCAAAALAVGCVISEPRFACLRSGGWHGRASYTCVGATSVETSSDEDCTRPPPSCMCMCMWCMHHVCGRP